MQNLDFRDLQKKNRRSTWLLMGAMFVILGVVGIIVGFYMTGELAYSAIGVVIALGMTAISYFASSKLALGGTGAVPAPIESYGRLHNVVEEMALAAGMPKPAVYVVHDAAPNAFATGRDPEHAAIAVTTGLLDKMDRNELQGVVAHEMAHIRNLDIRVMTVAVATAGAIAIIADIFWRMLFFSGGSRSRSNNRDGGAQVLIMVVGYVVVAILAPLAAGLMRAAVSRSREGLADATAVELTRHPEGLRKALEKLDADVTVVRRTSHATSHLWIEAPDDHQPGHKGRRFNAMFNTHPPLHTRIMALRQMEGLEAYTGPDPALREELSRRVDNADKLRAAAVAHQVTDPTAASGVAAGWFDDPGGSGRLRWWDGSAWSHNLH